MQTTTTTSANPNKLTAAIMADAGLYREWICKVYGQLLNEGGDGAIWSHAIKHCKRLARLTGSELDEIVRQASSDYEAGGFFESWEAPSRPVTKIVELRQGERVEMHWSAAANAYVTIP